jgi:cyclopropane-fatty-acyl-phospholipid synthase
MGAMVEAARGTGLAVTAVRDIGPDYAITLRAWRAAWRARKADVLSLGYSEVFWLKYDFYFAFCEAAFDARYIHDFHVTWDKQAEPDSSADTSAGGNAAAAAATRLHGWARQELPSDGATQVCAALRFPLLCLAC